MLVGCVEGRKVMYFHYFSFLQNIILRLAERNQMNTLYDPRKDYNHLPKLSQAYAVLSKNEFHQEYAKNHLYHVMAYHTIFDYEGAK